MKKLKWVDAASACEFLEVKPQTLYAYVSRSQIRVKADAQDTRRSLYALSDIEELLRKKRRPRSRSDIANAAIRWGDPVLETAISEVRDGMLWMRGKSLSDCAKSMSLEDVTALLLGADQSDQLDISDKRVELGGIFARAMRCLADAAETASPIMKMTDQELALETETIISTTTDAILGQVCSGPIHQRFADAWNLGPKERDIVRKALVLLSENELNPSTFAVRVCASTGASLAAALLAGMATLSGTRHGDASKIAVTALEQSKKGLIDAFLQAHSDQSAFNFGFGHPLYPEGDPRATVLLRCLPSGSNEVRAVQDLSRRVSLAPNVDMAMAAVTLHFDLPRVAPQAIFAVARLSGWSAHAVEQGRRSEIIRPRSAHKHP